MTITLIGLLPMPIPALSITNTSAMKYLPIPALVLLLLCSAIPGHASNPVSYEIKFSGLDFGNTATAEGIIVLDTEAVPNPGSLGFFIPPVPAWVLSLTLTVSGAGAGNGTFTLADFSAINWDTAGRTLDLSRELVGQDGWGYSGYVGGVPTDDPVGDFNFFPALGSSSPDGPYPPYGVHQFIFDTNGNADLNDDLLQLTSFAPTPTPEPGSAVLLVFGIAGVVLCCRRRQPLQSRHYSMNGTTRLLLLAALAGLCAAPARAVEVEGLDHRIFVAVLAVHDVDQQSVSSGNGSIGFGPVDSLYTASAVVPGAQAGASAADSVAVDYGAHYLNFTGTLNLSSTISANDTSSAKGSADTSYGFDFDTDEPLHFAFQVIASFTSSMEMSGFIDCGFGPYDFTVQYLRPATSATVSGIIAPEHYLVGMSSSYDHVVGYEGAGTNIFSGSLFVSLKLAPQAITTPVAPAQNFGIIAEVTAPSAPGSLGSIAKLLDGAASTGRDVSVEFLPAIGSSVLASDVADVHGTGTDTFVLQLTYNEAAAIALFGSEAAAILGWRDPADGLWKNAVLGNDGGTPNFVGDRAYDPATDFALGNYGVDTAHNHVWAVINHNSEFAAAPEPGSAVLLALGAAGLALRRRRRA